MSLSPPSAPSTDHDAGTRARPVVLVVLAALAIAALALAVHDVRAAATTRVVEGWAVAAPDGLRLTLTPAPPGAAAGAAGAASTEHVVAAARWAGPDGVWHEAGGPVGCVDSSGDGTPVRLGLVDVRPHPDGGGGEQMAVWVRCGE